MSPVVPLIGTVMPFARLSPTGKFRFDVVGLDWGVLVIEMYPAPPWPTTVRLPVMASALTGIELAPAMLSALGTPFWNAPLSAMLMPGRVSRIRFGVSLKYCVSGGAVTVM